MKFEIVFIVILVLLQVFVFVSVYLKIKAYKNFFPGSYKEIQIKKFTVSRSSLSDPELFDKFLDSISLEELNSEVSVIGEQAELLVVPTSTKTEHIHFAEVIKSTNAYLCKNRGASADFSILKDTCERYLEKVDNEIGNLINVPLYIGLAGTFVGIIIGLWGIDFSATTEGTTTVISSQSIGQLLNGVIAAMFASLVGLMFTVVNSAMVYKPAAFKNDTDKNHYYDFLQRELLPILNIGVSRTLGSFKDVLNHFILKFGENMNDYKDSGQLLNDNLQKQQSVLEEINKLSLTRTATKIADVFSDLKESSEHLQTFLNYQKGLNGYIDKTETVASDFNQIISQFKEFNLNLKTVSGSVVANIELQKQFKESLELHFPTISDHREVWRLQIDELNQDIKAVYIELNEYFKRSTDQIQSFIGSNNNFFTGVNDIQNAIKVFVENSAIQKDQFLSLKQEMVEMRNDFRSTQKQSYEAQNELIDVLIELKKTLSKIEISKN